MAQDVGESVLDASAPFRRGRKRFREEARQAMKPRADRVGTLHPGQRRANLFPARVALGMALAPSA